MNPLTFDDERVRFANFLMVALSKKAYWTLTDTLDFKPVYEDGLMLYLMPFSSVCMDNVLSVLYSDYAGVDFDNVVISTLNFVLSGVVGVEEEYNELGKSDLLQHLIEAYHLDSDLDPAKFVRLFGYPDFLKGGGVSGYDYNFRRRMKIVQEQWEIYQCIIMKYFCDGTNKWGKFRSKIGEYCLRGLTLKDLDDPFLFEFTQEVEETLSLQLNKFADVNLSGLYSVITLKCREVCSIRFRTTE